MGGVSGLFPVDNSSFYARTGRGRDMKEGNAYSIMALTPEHGNLITHDDRLLVRAQKVDHYRGSIPVGIGLTADWKYKDRVEVVHGEGGEPVIVNYCRSYYEGRERMTKTLTVEEYERRWSEVDSEDMEAMNELQSYAPQYLRGVKLADDVYMRFQDNRMDLRICSLMNDLQSRYRIALDSCVRLIDEGVFRYEARSEDAEPRNKQEAMRNRIKRYGKVAEYEHDILFQGDIGKAIYDDLSAYAQSVEGLKTMAVYADKGTVYLQGVRAEKGETQAKVKYYDIGKREAGRAGVGVESGRYYKLETTMLGPYFKKHGIGIEDMLEADEIQARVSPYLMKVVGRYIGRVRTETMRMIQAELGLGDNATVSEIVRETFRPERTLTQRVEALERGQRELERVQREQARDIARLKAQAKR